MTWATSASVGMPFSISRSGAGAWLTSPSQARQAYLGRRRTSTLNCAGVTFEPLGDILANPMLETATARAGFICDIDDDLFARQMWRQRAAIDASLARQSRRLVAVLLLTGFSDSERLFQILECERQLIGVRAVRPGGRSGSAAVP